MAAERAATNGRVARRSFRAMGSDAEVIVVGGPPGLVDQALARLDQLESRWSRFRPDSEITQLNRQAGRPLVVSADTVLLVERAVAAWRFSGGAFDPTVLGPVIRSGYNRSFERLGPHPVAGHSPLGLGAADIAVDGRSVQLPHGTGFDPGGIGKGLAADLVASEVTAAGADGVCINLGGDLRVTGSAPEGGPWTVAVEHPWLREPLALIGLHAGGVATSTTLRRRWQVDGHTRHHLIDPRSGQPSESDLDLASVVASEAWIAEALTKSVLLRGSAHAFDVIDGTGAEALAVDGSGQITTSDRFGAYVGDGVAA
jgi:FAD:protein FMN transferase